MAKFIYKKRIGRRSRKDTKLVNSLAFERKAIFSSVFQNENNGNYFELEDVQIIRYKRNRTVNLFFETYSNKSKYQLFEFGIPFHISDNLSVKLAAIESANLPGSFMDVRDVNISGGIFLFNFTFK